LDTIQAYPVSQRRIIGQLNRNQCRYLADSEANYHHDSGHSWVLIWMDNQTGWVASEYFSVFQEEADVR
jgi:hypothetical protein